MFYQYLIFLKKQKDFLNCYEIRNVYQKDVLTCYEIQHLHQKEVLNCYEIRNLYRKHVLSCYEIPERRSKLLQGGACLEVGDKLVEVARGDELGRGVDRPEHARCRRG